jgi:hypothetical protein
MAGTRQGWQEPAVRHWRPFAWPRAVLAGLPLWRAVGAQAGRTKQAPALPAELVGILSMRHPGTLLQEMVLDAELAELLAQVISEQRQRHRLDEFGLKPMRKLLLTGEMSFLRMRSKATCLAMLAESRMRMKIVFLPIL